MSYSTNDVDIFIQGKLQGIPVSCQDPYEIKERKLQGIPVSCSTDDVGIFMQGKQSILRCSALKKSKTINATKAVTCKKKSSSTAKATKTITMEINQSTD